MKSLKTIQVLAKVGKILSKIVFIFCCIGFCGCIISLICLGLGVAETIHMGDFTLYTGIAEYAGLNQPTLFAGIAVGLVFCTVEGILSKTAELYFKHELADGTPFTLRGANELKRLGVLTIVLPLAATILCVIGVAIAESFDPEITRISVDGFASVGLGIMMLILSLFCRYGVEVSEGKAMGYNAEKE